MSNTANTVVPSIRIANSNGMSLADKAFFQIVYSCVYLGLYAQTPSVNAPSSVILRLSNCPGCGSSPNSQYQLGQANAQQITYLSQFATSKSLQTFIQNILSQVLVGREYNLPPVQMFFSNFQTIQDIQTTLFNHIPPIYMQQLQNVAKIAASGIYDIRNYDCTVNGTLTIDSKTIVKSFADQITAVITISASHCISAPKNFPFFLYNSATKTIAHPLGKNNVQINSTISSFCVLNNSNSIVDAITFEIVGNTSVSVSVNAIDSTGAPLQSPIVYTTQNVFHTFSVNPGQGYAITIYTSNLIGTVYVTGMTKSYLPPPVNPITKNTYIPPESGLPFLIKWKGTSLYLGQQGYLVPKYSATIFTYDKLNNIISPPVVNSSGVFLNKTGSPVNVQILSYGDSALLANTGYPGQTNGTYAYTFNQNSIYYNENDWVPPFSYINNNVASALSAQSDIFAFDYEYVIISTITNPNNYSNKLLVNSTLLNYLYKSPGSPFVSGDMFVGSISLTNENGDLGYYATNFSTDTISLLAVVADVYSGSNNQGNVSVYYAQNSQPLYSNPILMNAPTPIRTLISVSIPPEGQFYVPFPGEGIMISVKPYVAHTSSNVLKANEYLTSGSVMYDPTQGFFVSSGDALWDSTSSYFMVLKKGDLCFGSRNLGVIYNSNPVTNGAGSFVLLTNDGKLNVIDKFGNSLWNSNNIPAVQTEFKLQENGDYLIFNGTTPIWSQRGIVPNTNAIPTVPNPVVPVPAGTFPKVGKKFVVASAATSQYLCDNGAMSSDISKAKVFTFNLLQQQTNEVIQTANTSPSGISLGSTNLMFNFNGINTLAGGTYFQSNGVIYYAIYFGIPSWSSWIFSGINYDVSDSLNNYFENYAVVLYYI